MFTDATTAQTADAAEQAVVTRLVGQMRSRSHPADTLVVDQWRVAGIGETGNRSARGSR